MFAVILISVGVPILTLAAFFALRKRVPNLVADVRGIALQTVIILVVLIAIAGAIAAVLVTRGNTAVTEADRIDVEIDATQLKSKELCEAAGKTWTAGTPGSCA